MADRVECVMVSIRALPETERTVPALERRILDLVMSGAADIPAVAAPSGVTPAMQAGIADHVWSIDEIVELLQGYEENARMVAARRKDRKVAGGSEGAAGAGGSN